MRAVRQRLLYTRRPWAARLAERLVRSNIPSGSHEKRVMGRLIDRLAELNRLQRKINTLRASPGWQSWAAQFDRARSAEAFRAIMADPCPEAREIERLTLRFEAVARTLPPPGVSLHRAWPWRLLLHGCRAAAALRQRVRAAGRLYRPQRKGR